MSVNIALLKENIRQYNIELTDLQCKAFQTYADLLVEWNEKMNLTAITDSDGIAIKHFSDSLSIYPFIKKYFPDVENKNISLVDVGTGAGFPGIPLKILLGNISLTLIDSLEKRIKFLNTVLGNIKMQDYLCVHRRAEDAGRDLLYREKYDISVARAVAPLSILLEYCLPFLKSGGLFFAMKGVENGEINDAKMALSKLGGEIIQVERFNLVKDDLKRTIIVVKKEKSMSSLYPRSSAHISKKSL